MNVLLWIYMDKSTVLIFKGLLIHSQSFIPFIQSLKIIDHCQFISRVTIHLFTSLNFASAK